MLASTFLSIALLSSSCYAVSWASIRTDEAAWQDACGHSARDGAVCLSAEKGDPSLYGVTSTAQQNVVFSGKQHYIMAYCPNLDKGEKPYTIQYGHNIDMAYYQILGRKSNEHCCKTQYTHHLDGPVDDVQCIKPAIIYGDEFPPEKYLVYPG